MRRQSATQIAGRVSGWPEGTRIEVLAPLVRGRKGEFRDLFEEALREGFVRARVDGELIDLSEPPRLNRKLNHDIAVVVDRLVLRPSERARVADSIETALRMAAGTVEVRRYPRDAEREAGDGRETDSHLFSEHYACPVCGISIPELEPRQFSFNSPYGACTACDGLGVRLQPNADLVIGDERISILEGVVLPWGVPAGRWAGRVLPPLADRHGFDLNAPWGELSREQRAAVLDGDPELDWEGALE